MSPCWLTKAKERMDACAICVAQSFAGRDSINEMLYGVDHSRLKTVIQCVTISFNGHLIFRVNSPMLKPKGAY